MGAIGFIIALTFTISIYDAFGGDSASSSSDVSHEIEHVAVVKQGDSVKSGHFKFTVTEVKDGVHKVGSSGWQETADGQYIVVSVDVKNIGDESETFWGDDQKLVDADGKKYSADDDAAIALEDSNGLLEEINPGNTTKGKLIFDVPKSVTPKFILFSGSMFGDPVKVRLT
ncbi:hypothetical protein GCM10027344_02300 [Spelaeicoccus albus]|nr:DUF4352 domain-containing protein [Spelaeicoccus albus]